MLLPLLTAMSETGLLERRLVPKLITIDHDDDLQGNHNAILSEALENYR